MMSENTTSKTSEADLPHANGASNGTAPNGDQKATDGPAPEKGADKAEASSQKKRKRDHRNRPVAASPPAPAETDAVLAAPPADDILTTAAETNELPTPVSETPTEASTEAPVSVPIDVPTAVPAEGLRLRMKVWTDPKTAKRYLMPTAFMRDIVKGRPVSDRMYAYAMSDDNTKIVTLTATEWNSLPFFYFQEDGPAPRASARPVDVIP